MLIIAKNILLGRTKDGHSPIYPGKIVEVDDAVGKEFIRLKAAEEVMLSQPETVRNAPPDENPNGNTPEDENGQNSSITGHLDGTDLEDMSFADLKALAQDMGIETGKIRSKSAMIEAISSVEVEVPSEEDDLPDLSPQDVVDE